MYGCTCSLTSDSWVYMSLELSEILSNDGAPARMSGQRGARWGTSVHWGKMRVPVWAIN